jgi:hypothetical protein
MAAGQGTRIIRAGGVGVDVYKMANIQFANAISLIISIPENLAAPNYTQTNVNDLRVLMNALVTYLDQQNAPTGRYPRGTDWLINRNLPLNQSNNQFVTNSEGRWKTREIMRLLAQNLSIQNIGHVLTWLRSADETLMPGQLADGITDRILTAAGLHSNPGNRRLIGMTSRHLGKLLHTEAVIEAMLLSGVPLTPVGSSTVFSFKDPCCGCIQLDWVQCLRNNLTFVSVDTDNDITLKSRHGYKLIDINDTRHPRELYYVVSPNGTVPQAAVDATEGSYNGPL